MGHPVYKMTSTTLVFRKGWKSPRKQRTSRGGSFVKRQQSLFMPHPQTQGGEIQVHLILVGLNVVPWKRGLAVSSMVVLSVLFPLAGRAALGRKAITCLGRSTSKARPPKQFDWWDDAETNSSILKSLHTAFLFPFSHSVLCALTVRYWSNYRAETKVNSNEKTRLLPRAC